MTTAQVSANLHATGSIVPGKAGSAIGASGTAALDWESGDAQGAAVAGQAVARIVPGSAGKALGAAAGGAAAGAAMGSVVFPGIGTAVGAVAGGIIGFASHIHIGKIHIGGKRTATSWHEDIITNTALSGLDRSKRGGNDLTNDARMKIKSRFPDPADQAVVRAWLYNGGNGSTFEERVFDATMAIPKIGNGSRPAPVPYNPFTSGIMRPAPPPPPIPARTLADSIVHEFVNDLLAYHGCPTSDQYLVAAHRALTKAQSEGLPVLELVQQKVSLVESVGLQANGLTSLIASCRNVPTARTTPRPVTSKPVEKAKSKKRVWLEVAGGGVGVVGIGMLAHRFLR